jgi:sugar phosphate isomerase/epimerase
MQFKLACADFAFPLLSHENSLALIGMLGFDGVDIGLFEGRSHIQPSDQFKNVATSARKLKKVLDDRGLKAADVFLQLDPDFHRFAINHPAAARRRHAREQFLKTLDYAAAVGSEHVTTLPGVAVDGEPRAAFWGRTCDELAWRVEQSNDRGLVFGTEAHIGSIADSPALAKRLVNDVPGLTLTLDYTHFTRKGMPDSAVEPLIPHASHFHARGACKGRLQASFDGNSIDYARVAEQMRKSGYRGYVGIEYVWTVWERCNEVDNLSETIRFRDFFRAQSNGNGSRTRVVRSQRRK